MQIRNYTDVMYIFVKATQHFCHVTMISHIERFGNDLHDE